MLDRVLSSSDGANLAQGELAVDAAAAGAATTAGAYKQEMLPLSVNRFLSFSSAVSTTVFEP